MDLQGEVDFQWFCFSPISSARKKRTAKLLPHNSLHFDLLIFSSDGAPGRSV